MPRQPPPPVLGEFEQIVMLALLRLGTDSYGALVCAEIEQRGGRPVSVSAVHTTLERLEQKGLVKSRIGEPTPQRGGKRKRHFEVIAPGHARAAGLVSVAQEHGRWTRRPARRAGMTPRPPTIAAWMVARTRSERYREEFLGDLEELFHARALEARPSRGPAMVLAASRSCAARSTRAAAACPERGRTTAESKKPRQPGGDSFMQTIGQDLRYAFRSLVAKPGFAATAIVMLALGIGANATIFSWVNSVLLNPMPGATRTSELVELAYIYKGDVLPSFSYPDYKDIAAASKQLSAIAAFDDLAVGVVVDREAERAWVELVSANFFDVLGVPVILGRSFAVSDDAPASPAAVILSHAYWQRRFAGDPAVIGRTIRINSQPFTIVGVAAEGFKGRSPASPLTCGCRWARSRWSMPGGNRLEIRGSRWAKLIGRLAPGASLDQARAEFESTIEQMRQHLVEPEPLHRLSRRALHARSGAGGRHHRAASSAPGPDDRRGDRPPDHVRQPGGPAARPRDGPPA